MDLRKWMVDHDYAPDKTEAVCMLADGLADLKNATQADLEEVTAGWKTLTKRRFLRDVAALSVNSPDDKLLEMIKPVPFSKALMKGTHEQREALRARMRADGWEFRNKPYTSYVRPEHFKGGARSYVSLPLVAQAYYPEFQLEYCPIGKRRIGAISDGDPPRPVVPFKPFKVPPKPASRRKKTRRTA